MNPDLLVKVATKVEVEAFARDLAKLRIDQGNIALTLSPNHINSANIFFIIAERKSEVVIGVCLVEESKIAEGKTRIQISSLYIHPQYRNSGAGKQLLLEVIAEVGSNENKAVIYCRNIFTLKIITGAPLGIQQRVRAYNPDGRLLTLPKHL